MLEHRSTSRVLDIFELVSGVEKAGEGYTLTEISEALDAPKGSLSPILHTLHKRGYLTLNGKSAKYGVGAMLYSAGYAYVSKGGFNRDIQPIMDGVVRRVSETCHFAELNGGDVFYLLKVDTPEAIRMFSSPGRLLPAYSTSLGKALLSGVSEADLKRLYSGGLQAVTENTVTDINALVAQLEEVRKTGFAFESGESTEFVRCVGVPIVAGAGVRYALSVATPSFRYSGEKEELICQALSKAKLEIEAILTK